MKAFFQCHAVCAASRNLRRAMANYRYACAIRKALKRVPAHWGRYTRADVVGHLISAGHPEESVFDRIIRMQADHDARAKTGDALQ